MAKKKRLDMTAAPDMPANSPFTLRAAPIDIEPKAPVCGDPLIDLVLIAVRAGMRVNFAWGTEGTFVPEARAKLHISLTPCPNSPNFKAALKYSVYEEIVDLAADNVAATLKRLLDSLPSTAPVDVIRPIVFEKATRIE